MLNQRAEFSAQTRELVARRAGYRCSLPRCGRTTVGAGVQSHQSASIGVAAHIYSAVAGGPRGSGGLTLEELASPANAIWLCANHAALIDKNEGADYSPGTLLSYKQLHEARIARELEGACSRFGWIDSLAIRSSPLFAEPTNFELGKLSLLIGDNETGKTALCEWLAAAVDVSYLKRWRPIKHGQRNLDAEVRYLDPEPHATRFWFPDETFPRYEYDGRETALPLAPIRVLFPKKLEFLAADEEPDDLARLSDALRMHPLQVRSLCERVSANATGEVTRLRLETREDRVFVFADVRGTHPGLPLRNLSGGECDRVMMTLAALAASDLATRYPTVLILDASSYRADNRWLRAYGEWLSSPTNAFQT